MYFCEKCGSLMKPIKKHKSLIEPEEKVILRCSRCFYEITDFDREKYKIVKNVKQSNKEAEKDSEKYKIKKNCEKRNLLEILPDGDIIEVYRKENNKYKPFGKRIKIRCKEPEKIEEKIPLYFIDYYYTSSENTISYLINEIKYCYFEHNYMIYLEALFKIAKYYYNKIIKEKENIDIITYISPSADEYKITIPEYISIKLATSERIPCYKLIKKVENVSIKGFRWVKIDYMLNIYKPINSRLLKYFVKNKNVLLIDDITTSGATLLTASYIIKREFKAKNVIAFVLAKTRNPNRRYVPSKEISKFLRLF